MRGGQEIDKIYTSGRRSSQSAFGSQLATALVATKHVIIFHSILFLPFSLLLPSLVEGVLRSKNLFCKSWWECQKTWECTPFQTPSATLGPPSNHFGFWRRCGVAGSERVTPAPLDWYFKLYLSEISKKFVLFSLKLVKYVSFGTCIIKLCNKHSKVFLI